MTDESTRVVATNRKAYHDYEVVESIEAGIVLTGTEIKSIRAGKVNLRDGFAVIRDGEVWLLNVHIAPYTHGNRENHEPRRERKLLLHRREIERLFAKVQERGWTLAPLNMHLRRNRAKVELGLVRGKRQYDKRQAIARRDVQRDLDRTLKGGW
ncbi:MAG: SsrA-binding protein SmpB [Caldilineales bacterium]|nr:SsrA-binding protein SmpB [Caldilineales bacterium]